MTDTDRRPGQDEPAALPDPDAGYGPTNLSTYATLAALALLRTRASAVAGAAVRGAQLELVDSWTDRFGESGGECPGLSGEGGPPGLVVGPLGAVDGTRARPPPRSHHRRRPPSAGAGARAGESFPGPSCHPISGQAKAVTYGNRSARKAWPADWGQW
ncbi:hypothetical protein GCM10010441_72540 [Kitasatospora paracochleata]